MANDDSTRPGFDLSPWLGRDPLTINEAACLWYGLKPGMTTELTRLYPVEWANTQSRATDMAKEAKAGKLPIRGEVPAERYKTRGATGGSQYLGTPSRPAEYRTVEDWGAACVALADVRAYAESIGERPAFFFPETAADFTGNSPGAGLGASDSGDAVPPKAWAHGVRRVAFDAAKAIVANGAKLTADGLEKAMLNSKAVKLKGDEYQLKTTDVNLTEREIKAKPKTIAGWVTDLKKLLKR